MRSHNSKITYSSHTLNLTSPRRDSNPSTVMWGKVGHAYLYLKLSKGYWSWFICCGHASGKNQGTESWICIQQWDISHSSICISDHHMHNSRETLKQEVQLCTFYCVRFSQYQVAYRDLIWIFTTYSVAMLIDQCIKKKRKKKKLNEVLYCALLC